MAWRVLPPTEALSGLRARLLGFYLRHARELPWRATRDPYAIWISEVMLQQTQVQTVLPRYLTFLERYPSVHELARASELEVCEAWAGLGYYRRARQLHAAARTVVRDHGGVLPASAEGLSALPGIGRYTAGAVASIAFGEPVAAVDGNVTRVLARLFALGGRVGEPALGKRVAELATTLVQGTRPGDVNQALMDLGATLCTPRVPRCAACPLAASCMALYSGQPTDYPQARVRRPVARLAMAFAWLEQEGGLWLERRSLTGLWPGLWELPSASGERAKRVLATRLGARLGPPALTLQHRLTHRLIEATVYRAHVAPTARPPLHTARLVTTPLAEPLSALARKAIVALWRAR